MTMKHLGCTAAVLAGTLTLAPAEAHHSYAAFDQCTPITLEGEIDSVEWANPHIRILLRTSESGSYSIAWFSLIQMRAALEPEALKSGDRVIVSGSAMRDLSKKILSLVTEIRRPSDGWTWERTRQRPASCAPTTAAN
jgi:hypothetical protein